MQYVTNPVRIPCFFFFVCRIFHSTLTFCNTSSFLLTRSLQLIFSILLEDHIFSSRVFLIYIPNRQSFSTLYSYIPKQSVTRYIFTHLTERKIIVFSFPQTILFLGSSFCRAATHRRLVATKFRNNLSVPPSRK